MSAKCPLGFQGDMPAGHPSVPGFLKEGLSSMGLDASNSGSSEMATYAWLAFDAVLLLVVVLALVYHDRPAFVKASKLPKIAPSYPLVGNLTTLLGLVRSDQTKQDGLLHFLLEHQRKTGKNGLPFTFTAPGPNFGGRATVINRPEYIQWAQKTNFETYDKGYAFRKNMADVLSHHGIFAADGEVWKKQRKMASHIFSVGNFRTHVQKTVQNDLGILRKLLDDASKSGSAVNLPDIFFRFTLDTFGEMAFSADLNCLPTEVAGLKKSVAFADAFDFAQTVMNERFFNPLWSLTEPFSAKGRRMRSSIKVLRKTCYEIIDKRIEAQSSGAAAGAVGSGGKDLLQLFMDQGLSREDLLPVVLNFIIAGRDTTAQALSWAFLELHKYPEVAKKIKAEADEVLGDRLMEYDDLKSMVYTQAVFLETLRLWPSVPKNVKVANKADVIRPYAQDFDRSEKGSEKETFSEERLPDLPIQKGTTVVWSDWVMGRMPEVWGDDCETFKPERFLKDGGKTLRQYSQYHFHAFNAGPRLCLGQTLATYEGCAVLALLCQNFNVQLNDQELRASPPTYADSLTLPIANPYNATFKAL